MDAEKLELGKDIETMQIPNIAIIGRPNVGKSSLLNAIAGRRVSIVEPTAGVTRDRVSLLFDWRGRCFEFVDTGGMGLVDEEQLKAHVARQCEIAMEQADLILFLFDAKEGVSPMDQFVAQKVRKLKKPVLLIANKVESRKDEFQCLEGTKLGFGVPLEISAKEGLGISDLCDAIVEHLPEPMEAEDMEVGIKLGILGKRNSGKSTLVNLLAGGERVIVSDIPGTTRDSVDVPFEREGRRWIAIDTAGLRKKSRVQDAIEFFSLARSERSVRRSDVILLLFDLSLDISQVDKKLSGFILQNYKPCILVANKVDLAGEEPDLDRWEAYLRQELPGLSFAPISFISALDQQNIDETLELAAELYEQAGKRVSTGDLNRVFQEARQQHAPHTKGKQPKLFYATQVDVFPPTILVFVNEPKLFTGQYDRYLQNRLREAFGWEEIPIRLVYKRREKVELPPE